ELWRPDTGAIEPASFSSQGDRTVVTLHLETREMVFVVFPRSASTSSRTLQPAVRTTVATIAGAWRVSFPSNLGAPPEITLPALQSWTKQADEGVRYFSGTATYRKSVDAPRAWIRPGARTLLDLGSVADVADVSVNGQ